MTSDIIQNKENIFNLINKLQNGEDNISFVNTLSIVAYLILLLREKNPLRCPKCGSLIFIKRGRYRVFFHRYQCKCGTSFNDFTGTPFAGLQKLDIVIRFLTSFFLEGTAVRKTGLKLHKNPKTILYWRHKMAQGLSEVLKMPLVGLSEMTICIDPINDKGSCHYKGRKYPQNRIIDIIPVNKKQTFCSVIACDHQGHAIMQHIDLHECSDYNFIQQWIKKSIRKGNEMIIESGTLLHDVTKKMGWGSRKVRLVKNSELARDSWRNISLVNELRNVYKKWVCKFQGIASKYQQLYYNIFLFGRYLENLNSPLEYLLKSLLGNRNTILEYRKKKAILLE